MLQLPCATDSDTTLALEIDESCWGQFSSMSEVTDQREITLSGGWVRRDFFALWLDGDSAAAAVAPGAHSLDRGNCRPRKVTVVQTLGQGMRQKSTSLTLIDSCILQWSVAGEDADSGNIRLESLTIKAIEIAVAR
jgi:hypothetical protein